MSWSDIASLIAAVSFALLVLAVAYPLIQLGRTFKRTSQAVEQLTSSADQTVQEATLAIQSATHQINKLDTVTSSASNVAQDVSAITTLVSASLGSPLIKLSAFSYSARAFFQRQVSVADLKSSYTGRVKDLRSALAAETETELD